jgi:sec-independent protein translocase protein TatB
MFDIGWTEIVMIAILAIIVIGPKDLPKVLRALGRWVRKARAVAREFQDSLDEVLRESDLKDLKDLKDQVEKASRVDPFQEVKKTVDPEGEIAGALESGAKEPERDTEPERGIDSEAEVAGASESGAKEPERDTEPERGADTEGEARPSDPDTEREARRSG